MWAHWKACVWEPVLKINLPKKNPQKSQCGKPHTKVNIPITTKIPTRLVLDWRSFDTPCFQFWSGTFICSRHRHWSADKKGKMYWMHSVSMHGTAASVKYMECTGAVTAAALFIRNPLAARCSWCQVTMPVQAFKKRIQQHCVPKKNIKGFQKAEFQK